ncbi:hypothetical protein J6590_092881 [Homalodisca vitripennis]|nr:hypothetical protein J6590_092881 [Homalodisca vitripennis]
MNEDRKTFSLSTVIQPPLSPPRSLPLSQYRTTFLITMTVQPSRSSPIPHNIFPQSQNRTTFPFPRSHDLVTHLQGLIPYLIPNIVHFPSSPQSCKPPHSPLDFLLSPVSPKIIKHSSSSTNVQPPLSMPRPDS